MLNCSLPADWEHVHLPCTDSTMLRLRHDDLWLRPAPYVLLTTDYQTAGHGQKGTHWEAEAGANLLFSFRMHPEALHAGQQFALSEAMALAVAETLDAYTADICVKWPNDVYWRDRKVCGMLLTHDLCGQHIAATLTGVGVNLNQTLFHSDAPNPASLRQITGRECNRSAVMHDIVAHFTALYALLSEGRGAELHHRYTQRLYRRTGWHVYADAAGHTFTARLVEVSPTGLLTLGTEQGTRRTFAFKEVRHVLPAAQ